MNNDKSKCITPCIKKNSKIIHPTTYETITSEEDFCLTETEYNTKEKKINQKTKCDGETLDENQYFERMEDKFKDIYRNSEVFLKIFYKLKSLEDIINWIEKNNFKPLNTRLRIIELGWDNYIDEYNLIDYRVTDFYVEVIKKKYMQLLINRLSKYIKIDNNKIYFGKGDNETNKKKETEIKNFIIEKLLNKDEINKFLVKYVDYVKDNKDKNNLKNTDVLIKDIIEYFESKIKKSL